MKEMRGFCLPLFCLVASAVAEDASDCSCGFQYDGCAIASLERLENPLVFSDGRLTPQACQLACQDFQIAALFSE